jgi:hypothetical protein
MTASISSSPNRSACVVLAETSRRSLPLTLPLRGSLPLPARGERAGVRGGRRIKSGCREEGE